MKHQSQRRKPELGLAGTVSRETLRKLETFASLLERWNSRINLVSRRDLPLLWSRHIEDSLQLLSYFPPDLAEGIDIGTGAGFPGLILAIVSKIPFHLVEADARKAAFLLEAARETGAPVHVHPQRIELSNVPPSRLVTARALAPLPRLLELCVPHLQPNGVCLLLKGRRIEDELTAATLLWHMKVDVFPSMTEPTARILRLSEIRRVDNTSFPEPPRTGNRQSKGRRWQDHNCD